MSSTVAQSSRSKSTSPESCNSIHHLSSLELVVNTPVNVSSSVNLTLNFPLAASVITTSEPSGVGGSLLPNSQCREHVT
jgi:hypothetical protein